MPLKVLFADDDKKIVDLFCEIARKQGYAPDFALTGEEAVKKIRKNSYNLAFIAYNFGAGITGLEAIAQINAFADIPLYLLSGSLEAQEKAEISRVKFIDKLSRNFPKEIKEKMQVKMPIESIFFEHPSIKKEAIMACSNYEIHTAQELATYYRSAFKIGGNLRIQGFKEYPGKRVLDYLEECLRKKGMSFSPEHPQFRAWGGSPHMIYGEKNIKNDLLRAMKILKKDAKAGGIARHAKRALISQLLPYENYAQSKLVNAYTFASSVFNSGKLRPIFSQLVNEGKAEKIKTEKGVFYRLKENR